MRKQFFLTMMLLVGCSVQFDDHAEISTTLRNLEEVNRTLQDVNRTLECTNRMLKLDPHETFKATMKRYNKLHEDVTKRDVENYLDELNSACKESLKK